MRLCSLRESLHRKVVYRAIKNHGYEIGQTVSMKIRVDRRPMNSSGLGATLTDAAYEAIHGSQYADLRRRSLFAGTSTSVAELYTGWAGEEGAHAIVAISLPAETSVIVLKMHDSIQLTTKIVQLGLKCLVELCSVTISDPDMLEKVSSACRPGGLITQMPANLLSGATAFDILLTHIRTVFEKLKIGVTVDAEFIERWIDCITDEESEEIQILRDSQPTTFGEIDTNRSHEVLIPNSTGAPIAINGEVVSIC